MVCDWLMQMFIATPISNAMPLRNSADQDNPAGIVRIGRFRCWVKAIEHSVNLAVVLAVIVCKNQMHCFTPKNVIAFVWSS